MPPVPSHGAPVRQDRQERVARAVWPWREVAARSAEQQSRAAAAARLQGVLHAAVGLVAAGLIYLFWHPTAAAVVAVLATLLLVVALVSPLGAYRRLDHWIARFAHGVGLAVTWLLMPLLYYLLFLPVGLVLRLRGRLRLTRSPEPTRPSYWIPRGQDRHDYRRQF